MKLFLALALSLAALSAPPVHAQTTVGEAARAIGAANDLVAAMKGERPYAETFAPVFVTALPEAQFRALVEQLEAQYGPLQALGDNLSGGEGGTFGIALRFERAIGHALIHIEATAPHRIDGFRLTSFDVIGDSAEKISAELGELPGTTSALVTPLDAGPPVFAHEADRPLAIGSTFKLYELSALAHQVSTGQRKWSDVVRLGPRSLPSGQMQDWPENAPVTLQTLATMMVSISDNTATDTLIRLVGQDALSAELKASGHSRPELNVPFLTTRQAFHLKGGEDTALAHYASADVDERAELLRLLDDQPVDRAKIAGKLSGAPRALDVEWFASARDVVGILDRIRKIPDATAREILAVNPSMSSSVRHDWKYVGYKGGSEPGVLNLSWLLEDAAGRWYAVVASWNDPAAPVDQGTLSMLAQRMVALASPD